MNPLRERELRQRAVDVVAVTNGPVIGWLGSHPYCSRVLAGVVSALEGTDVQVRVHALPSPVDLEALDAIAARASVGVVLADVPLVVALRFQRRCRRVVSLVATSPSVPATEADNAGGAYAAVEYLHRSSACPSSASAEPSGGKTATGRRIRRSTARLLLDGTIAVAFADQFVDSATNLEVAGNEPGEGPVSLRWVLTHMLEEYARHNGHADLLREQIDGAVGL